jgi:hypothetical protein
MLIRHRNDNEFTLSKWKWKEEVLSYYPSFVQAWACLKLVSRAKQSLPVISLEIPVRPSVVDKNQTLGNLAQVQPKKARTRKPLPMPKRWLNNKQSNPWEDRTWMETEVFTAAAKRNNREKARGSKYRKSRKSEQTALETVTLLELEKRRITQVVHWNWKREASVVYIDRPQWKRNYVSAVQVQQIDWRDK